MRLGSGAVQAAYVGATSVSRAYLGTALVWSAAPQATAPSITLSEGVAGRVWTLAASATGAAPITFALAFTVDGVSVALTPEVTGGVHVWTYTAPASFNDASLAWTLTATNAVGSAEESGTQIIPADQFVAINSVTFDVGGVLIDYTGNLADAFDVAGVLVEVS